jgi:hypothetical protein
VQDVQLGCDASGIADNTNPKRARVPDARWSGSQPPKNVRLVVTTSLAMARCLPAETKREFLNGIEITRIG